MRLLLVLSLLCFSAATIAEQTNSQKQRTFEEKSTELDRLKRDQQAKDKSKIGRSPQCEGSPGSKTFPACF